MRVFIDMSRLLKFAQSSHAASNLRTPMHLTIERLLVEREVINGGRWR